MNKSLEIDGKFIAVDASVYIIAEMSANHLMDYDRAIQIIDGVKAAGADAVKLQTYTADTMTIDCNNPEFQILEGLWAGETLYSLYQKAYTPWEWQKDLLHYARKIGLTCFSTPFDVTAVDLMQKIGMPAYKVASLEINDIPLLRKIAKTQKPMIISTGVAHLEDVERALDICKSEGNENVMLLKCASAYPCPYEDVNLNSMPLLGNTFNCLVGLSDHTLGSEVALGAVALGARVIEKHVTIKRSDGGPDGDFSMELNEFADMIRQIRNLEKSLGTTDFKLTNSQENSRKSARSLYIVEDVAAGKLLTQQNVRSIRPGNGMHTMYYDDVIGKKARWTLTKGTPLHWDMIE